MTPLCMRVSSLTRSTELLRRLLIELIEASVAQGYLAGGLTRFTF